MTGYDRYVFFLCLAVFLALTCLFAVFIFSVVDLTLRLIRCGGEDGQLREEKGTGKPSGRMASRIVDGLLLLLLGLLLLLNLGGRVPLNGAPALRVVKSDSMARKAPGNDYLEENGLDDQLEMFDLILTHPLPGEFDLKRYDVVVYRWEGMSIVHRIVDIEEPNDQHPGRRLFTLQGDAVERPDAAAVEYIQMEGIYRGRRIPFAGSFVLFLQSPAGWLCMLLLAFAVFISPVIERRIAQEKRKRLQWLGDKEKNGPVDVIL